MQQDVVYFSDDKRVSLTSYIQPQCNELPNQTALPALIIFPGGGYKMLSERESEPVAFSWLAKGYNVFILRYSIQEYAAFPQPMLDAFKAITHVRQQYQHYNIDPDKIALLGFSAGGHLAASVGTLWNREEYQRLAGVEGEEHKPNALVLAYPVITTDWMKLNIEANLKNILRDKFDDPKMISTVTCHRNVGTHTPPTFLFHTTEDQSVPASDSLKFAAALDDNQIPYELHIFQRGPHGISRANALTDDGTGLKIEPEVQCWGDLCSAWLDRLFEHNR
ncbi:alpha/beta hydrolase [Vibrio algivorus]|uniref:Acetylesterase n=1 Tax=Vibrio algivorus TaxID=1667024 RepID=A0ABQ6ESB9_9VIBR|nr:alpha/beta hydrolase [Vibrio algivorus]GLT15909.1 acetylesterase [Vibrio algivorus]